MAMSYMQMIWVGGKDRAARQTGVGAAFATNAETWQQFQFCRELEVPQERSTFLLDYHNAKGDLAGTIFLDNAGFEKISNEKVKTDAEYRKIDADYWVKARTEYDAARKAA